MNLNVQLLDWQKKVWQSEAKYKIVTAGRRVGKTELAAWRLIVNALTDGITDKDAHRFYVATTLKQARRNMWGKIHQLAHPVIKKSHINDLEITLINDAVITFQGADNPEPMRGVKLADLVLDEYADMKPFVLEEILEPALADYDTGYLMIGTPKGRNRFYEEFLKASEGDDPLYEAWSFTTYDNPHISKAFLERKKKTMTDHAFRQEFLASFESKGSEVFSEEWVQFYTELPKGYGQWFIAIDLAGFEEVGKKNKTKNLDQSAIACVFIAQNGDWYVDDIIKGRWTLDETAERIVAAVEKYKPVKVGIEKGIAKQAVMSPLTDMQRRKNRVFPIHDLTHGNQKKNDRIAWALQGRFQNRMVYLRKGSDWVVEFLDQLFQFPDQLTHDDMIDALAYVDQLSDQSYLENYVLEDFDLLDDVAGW
jgi:predicted phage terminase large subunit-like protein